MKLEAYSKEYFTELRKHHKITLSEIGNTCNCTKQAICGYGNPLLYTLVLNMLIHEKEGESYNCSFINEFTIKRDKGVNG